MSRPLLFALLVTLAGACGGKSIPPPSTASEAPPSEDQANAERAQLTAAQCEAEGGRVVGDIGDGATQRPGYLCEGSGVPPIGNVVASPGGPMGVEGAVCCK